MLALAKEPKKTWAHVAAGEGEGGAGRWRGVCPEAPDQTADAQSCSCSCPRPRGRSARGLGGVGAYRVPDDARTGEGTEEDLGTRRRGRGRGRRGAVEGGFARRRRPVVVVPTRQERALRGLGGVGVLEIPFSIKF